VVLAVALLAACAGSSSPRTGSATSGPPTTGHPPGSSTSRPVAVETFTGSTDAFYRAPVPLPAGRPGDLIRVQAVGSTGASATVRVMYHSRDARRHDRAVTGLVTYPTGPAPKGGWPVVSWAHGTTGLASPCAPSRLGGTAPHFGVAGVDVATDYIGMGPVGERLPYLSGASEAHSVIDAVRAARNLRAAHAGPRWLAIGHSQGGHSALFTNQLAGSYAPELQLLGTVSLAPAAVFTRTFGPADQLIPRMVLLMGLYGMQAEYPEIDPNDYVGPAIAKGAGAIDSGCMNGIINAFAGVPGDQFYRHSPLTTEPAKSIILANDPGRVKAASPLLLVYGSADAWVVPARALALFHQLCAVGQVTQLLELPGATHDTEVGQGAGAVAAWFADRLAGKPVHDSC